EELARCCYGLAFGHNAARRHREALPSARRAVALWGQLATESPQGRRCRVEVGHAHWDGTGGPAGTRGVRGGGAAAREALPRRADLSVEDAKERYYRQETGLSLRKLGDVLHAAGRERETAESYGKAVRIYGELVREVPDDPFYRAELARSQFGF